MPLMANEAYLNQNVGEVLAALRTLSAEERRAVAAEMGWIALEEGEDWVEGQLVYCGPLANRAKTAPGVPIPAATGPDIAAMEGEGIVSPAALHDLMAPHAGDAASGVLAIDLTEDPFLTWEAEITDDTEVRLDGIPAAWAGSHTILMVTLKQGASGARAITVTGGGGITVKNGGAVAVAIGETVGDELTLVFDLATATKAKFVGAYRG